MIGEPKNLEIRLVNVVSTADLMQTVELPSLNKYSWGLYDWDIYPAGYLKDKAIQGKVTVFHSGKLISVGAKSVEKSFENLHHAHDLLLSVGIIKTIRIKPKVQNIVAVANLKHGIDLLSLARYAPRMIYEPEEFAGGILRDKSGVFTMLVFASGKIVIAGAKETQDLSNAIKLIQSLESAMTRQQTGQAPKVNSVPQDPKT